MTPVRLCHELTGPAGGPPLMLGGSLGTTLAMWEPQLPALESRHRVIRYDHRGHGGSPVPDGAYEVSELGGDVLALMDRLGIERASYCGLSLGGMVGMWLAAHAPERIERLILICTSAHLPAAAAAYAQRAAAVRAAASLESVADGVLARWLTPAFAAARPEVVDWLRAMLLATPPVGYAGCCEAIARLDLRADLPAVAAPTLVIAAEQDPATPPEYSRLIASTVPHARLEIISPAAHLASVERATEVSRLIVGHLEG